MVYLHLKKKRISPFISILSFIILDRIRDKLHLQDAITPSLLTRVIHHASQYGRKPRLDSRKFQSTLESLFISELILPTPQNPLAE